MRLDSPLSIITPTIDAGILQVLAGAQTGFTASQIKSILPDKGSLAGVRNALARLTAQGIVTQEPVGNLYLYRLNRHHLAARSIIELSNLKSILVERIRDDILRWKVAPKYAALFGSAARNDMSISSDIDIFFAVSDNADFQTVEDEVYGLSQKITQWTGNDARPLIFRAREIHQEPIIDEILRDAIPLCGKTLWLSNTLKHNGLVA